MLEFYGIIRGRVQLVMFRDFVRRRAARLGILGSVKNLRDGTVEVIAQGEKKALDTLIGSLHRGSLLSRVDSVDVTWRSPTTRFDHFRIVY